MAGFIFEAPGTIFSLESGGLSLSNNSQVAAGLNLDNRVNGNSSGMYLVTFELNAVSGWGADPGSGAQTNLYLTPAIDGTNFVSVNTMAHIMPPGCFRGAFTTVISGSQRMVIEAVPVEPLLYGVYLDNQTGQTMASGWVLRAVASEDQYT